MLQEIIFDVETKTFFDETGTRDPSSLGISIVSIYKRSVDDDNNETDGIILSFFEKEIPDMWKYFSGVDRVIGYNSLKFDVPALKPYYPDFFPKLNHFDIALKVKEVFGRMVKLDSIAKDTLGSGKIDSGANAVKYYKKGDPESLKHLQTYCESDVIITKNVYDYGVKNKKLIFTDHWNTKREIDIDFSYPEKENTSQIGLF